MQISLLNISTVLTSQNAPNNNKHKSKHTNQVRTIAPTRRTSSLGISTLLTSQKLSNNIKQKIKQTKHSQAEPIMDPEVLNPLCTRNAKGNISRQRHVGPKGKVCTLIRMRYAPITLPEGCILRLVFKVATGQGALLTGWLTPLHSAKKTWSKAPELCTMWKSVHTHT